MLAHFARCGALYQEAPAKLKANTSDFRLSRASNDPRQERQLSLVLPIGFS